MSVARCQGPDLDRAWHSLARRGSAVSDKGGGAWASRLRGMAWAHSPFLLDHWPQRVPPGTGSQCL